VEPSGGGGSESTRARPIARRWARQRPAVGCRACLRARHYGLAPTRFGSASGWDL